MLSEVSGVYQDRSKCEATMAAPTRLRSILDRILENGKSHGASIMCTNETLCKLHHVCVCACVFIERERVVYGIGFTTLLGIDVDM